MAPIVLEIVFVIVVIGVLYPFYFCLLVLGTVVIYLLVTVYVTEWRAKHFKAMTKADNEYS